MRHDDQNVLLFTMQIQQQGCDVVRRAGSRLPVGSSHNKSPGWRINARAIATRCFSPPDNSAGRWSHAIELDETCLINERARRGEIDSFAVVRDQRRHEDVLENRALRQKTVILEYEPDP